MSDHLGAVAPWHRLLLAVLRRQTTVARPLLAETSVVERAWALARDHQVPTLFAVRLREDAVPLGTPPELVERSERMLRTARGLNHVVTERTREYLARLEAAGIRAVALKGVALAQTVYPSPELRTFRDLDLLVPEERLDDAVRCLVEGGLRKARTVGDDEREHFHHHLRASDGLVVELHWALTRPASPYRLDPAGVLERARAASGGMAMPSLEDQVLHAAAQSLSEGFSRLLRVCDLERIVSVAGDRLDWDAMAQRARSGRLAPSVDLLLRCGQRLLGMPRPEGAARLGTPASVFAGLEPHGPARLLLTRATTEQPRLRHLLRFWLLPGARRTVVRQAILGSPRDRARRDAGPLRRLAGLARRTAVVASLLGSQLRASLVRRGDDVHLSPS